MTQASSTRHSRFLACVIPILAHSLGTAQSGKAGLVIDNDRVAVWDVTDSNPEPDFNGDSVRISLAPEPGRVMFRPKGAAARPLAGGHAIVIDLKDRVVEPLANTSGYPNAFPRPGAKKLFENNRVVVWDYTWMPGQPTPMHFHDKDVVAVDLETGVVKSTTLDKRTTENQQTAGAASFNPRGRVHTEELVKGRARRILTELK